MNNNSMAKALVGIAGCILIGAVIIVTKDISALWALILIAIVIETIE